MSDLFNDDFSFKLSAINRLCSSRVALRELDRESNDVRVIYFEFKFSMCEPTLFGMQNSNLFLTAQNIVLYA